MIREVVVLRTYNCCQMEGWTNDATVRDCSDPSSEEWLILGAQIDLQSATVAHTYTEEELLERAETKECSFRVNADHIGSLEILHRMLNAKLDYTFYFLRFL